MSHFSTVHTKIKLENKEWLIKACKEVVTVSSVIENGYVTGYSKQAAHADIVATLTNSEYDLGFIRNSEGCFSALADFDYGNCSDLSGSENLSALLREITSKYARIKTEHELASIGAKGNVTVKSY